MTVIDDRVFAVSEGINSSSYIVATYLFQGPAEEDILTRASSAAMEQTVGRGSYRQEAFNDLVEDRGGKLINIFRVPDHECKPSLGEADWVRYLARIAYPAENTGYQIPMLLTTLMGDLSLGGIVKLVDLHLPEAFIKTFQGPKFGLMGVRSYLDTNRPLVCSILKPCVGLPAEAAAKIFYQHAIGGADVIKDDELMAYSDELRIEDRVKTCMQAAKLAYEETGHHTLYLTSITDRPDRMLENARRAIDAGANGLMITPLSTGIASLQMLAEDPQIQVILFAHPALLGVMSWSPNFGISGHILVAKLFRLAGADINALPVPYGKFAHLRESYIKLIKLSKAPMEHIKPTFSQVGGGLNPWNIQDVILDVGNDIMLVVGGSIQQHPMGLAAGIRAVQQAITATLDEVPLKEAVEDYPELRAAQSIWG